MSRADATSSDEADSDSENHSIVSTDDERGEGSAEHRDRGEQQDDDQAWTSEDVQKELSFEDVLKLRSRVGTKAYDRAAGGGDSRRPRPTDLCKRLNKNRPSEVSSKKRAPFLRQVVAVKKTTLRDPRFDDLSGEYKAEIFDKTYRFIDDIRRREAQALQKQLKKTKNADRKEKLGSLLKKMANRERARQQQEERRTRELQFKKEQRERADRGARPFFLKKSEQKKAALAARFTQLKKSGKLDAFLGKKRKRNAGKDRRKLPPLHGRATASS
ncbi:ribosomal RNA processing protein 36 homolog [Corythoichthys intestinalis]|uniref:ribosomal RNA processing protein 36 homolog n=1 Tax=Corythoichthys intestinalis TaxID=161448 RepID=UPI0025A5F235|nr:ribosomal RNA processing protein 36 homolog [Corythoichthys intestinalis]